MKQAKRLCAFTKAAALFFLFLFFFFYYHCQLVCFSWRGVLPVFARLQYASVPLGASLRPGPCWLPGHWLGTPFWHRQRIQTEAFSSLFFFWWWLWFFWQMLVWVKICKGDSVWAPTVITVEQLQTPQKKRLFLNQKVRGSMPGSAKVHVDLSLGRKLWTKILSEYLWYDKGKKKYWAFILALNFVYFPFFLYIRWF